MGSEATAATAAGEPVQHEMLDEGRRLVDAASSAGLTLRLLGGLAVREHCRTTELCERDYSDLDMVAPARHARRLVTLFAGFGYVENYEVSTATANRELQFVRPCAHGRGPGLGHAHADDHVDVFLDTFRMDHDIALARRLEIEPYTVSLSDLLLTKLQIFRLEEKDLRDGGGHCGRPGRLACFRVRVRDVLRGCRPWESSLVSRLRIWSESRLGSLPRPRRLARADSVAVPAPNRPVILGACGLSSSGSCRSPWPSLWSPSASSPPW